MREITSHIVKAHEPVKITVLDHPGVGGACYDYLLEYGTGRREINFQNGRIPAHGINGVTNEALLAIVLDRLNGFQSGPSPCDENEVATVHVQMALIELNARTALRLTQGVEGTNSGHVSLQPAEPEPEPLPPPAPSAPEPVVEPPKKPVASEKVTQPKAPPKPKRKSPKPRKKTKK